MEHLRILCFGDSLTEGYTRSGTLFHPYAESLNAYLKKAFPTTELHVDIEGLSGDRVCPPGLFMPRMEAKCKSNFYDWVVLLGGTNDLGWGGEPDKIFTCLQNVERVPLLSGANILVLTVPEVSLVQKNLDDRRDALNANIKDQCDDKRIFLFDLHTKMPYHTLPPSERDKIWDDGVHFTATGYDIMGEHIAERLMQVIPLARSKQSRQAGNSVGSNGKDNEKATEKTNPLAKNKSEVCHKSHSEKVSDSDFDTEEELIRIKQEGYERDSRARERHCGMCVIQ